MDVFAIVFWIIFVLYLWFAFSIAYHFIRFGIGIKPKILAFIFFIGSFVLFAAVVYSYSLIDWSINWKNVINLY